MHSNYYSTAADILQEGPRRFPAQSYAPLRGIPERGIWTDSADLREEDADTAFQLIFLMLGIDVGCIEKDTA